MSEQKIEDAILSNPAAIGYPNTVALRNVTLAANSGRIDLMLVPRKSLHRLVLIEAKVSDSSDARSKVVGQLLSYYSHALLLGLKGIERFREYAESNPEAAEHTSATSLKHIVNGDDYDAAWKLVRRGRTVLPQEVAMYIAVDGTLHPALRRTITMLHVHHNLNIGVIQVSKGTPRVLPASEVMQRLPGQDVWKLDDTSTGD